MSSRYRSFSTVYVEDGACNFPLAQQVLNRFPNAHVIPIRNYKEVFNRPRQNWASQKQAPGIILAKKKDDFLYHGSSIAPDFGFEHFYYNALVLNCLYDCHYCYLQGMYDSANIVVFVNSDEYFSAVESALARHSPMYLCISYDTDLLALESIIPYCAEWISFASNRPDLFIELRTKSASYTTISHLPASKNVILAWTLSPDEIQQRYEPKTPSLSARIRAARQALDDGWPVRICVDPVLAVKDWRSVYQRFFDTLRSELSGYTLQDVSVGSFRMNEEYFKRIKKRREDTDIFYQNYEVRDGLVLYPREDYAEVTASIRQLAEECLNAGEFSVCVPYIIV